MSRVLGARRLSHDTDASTSVERQGDSIAAWAKSHDHRVIHMTDDTDVSGAVSPFDRDDLGPWLRAPKLAQWDILGVARLDRISRSLIDFANLLTWCTDNGKTLVSVAESLDFSTPTGQFIGKILVLFAEWERQTMRTRRADASRKIAANAGWHGGNSTSWGYRPVQQDGRWALDPDPDQVPIIREIVQAVLDGESAMSVGDRHGIDNTRLIRRLRSPSLYGMVIFKGEVVRGPDGMPVMRHPVIDRATWKRLQARLDQNSKGKGIPRDAAPWLHVIHCGICGYPLYLQKYAGRPNRYYTHKRGLRVYRRGEREWCPVSAQGHAIESQIDDVVLRAWRGRYATEVVEIAGEDHTDELHQVEEAIADWEAQALLPGASAGSIRRVLDVLNAKRQAIIDAGVVTQSTVEEVTTEVRLTDMWLDQPDDHAKGALLRKLGYRIYVQPDGRGQARVRLERVWQHKAEPPRTWHEIFSEADDPAAS